ncbi:MAG: CcmD family protein [Mucilaginibacter sp.]|nr:CcmD family protein [Mucilaginibacter sp.]
MKKFKVLLLFLLSFSAAFAQQSTAVEMDDVLRSSGKIYVVVLTIVIIFAGLAIYLFSIDRRLKKIEKEK